MIGRLGRVRIYAYSQPTDLRKGWEGLSGLVQSELGGSPTSGSLYLFTNRRRTLAKVLYFDGTGLCILQKRLERGRFAPLWNYSERKRIPLKKSELELFLEGSHLVARFHVSPHSLSEKELASSDEI